MSNESPRPPSSLVTRHSSLRPVRYAQIGLFLAVDLGWLVAWSVALGSWTGSAAAEPAVGLPLLVALAGVSTGLTRLVLARGGASRWGQIGLPLLGLLVALGVGAGDLVAMRGDPGWGLTWVGGDREVRAVAAMAVAVLAWWRGIAAGRARLTVDAVESGVRGASLALAAVFLMNGLAPSPYAAPTGPLVGAVLVVVFAGLVGMPLARVLDLSASERHQGGPGLGVNRHWLAMLLGTVGILLLVAIVLALTLTFERVDQLTRPLGAAADLVLWVLIYAIAVPLGFLVEGLIDLVRLLIHPGAPRQVTHSPIPNILNELRNRAGSGAGPPEILLLAVKVAVAAIVVALVLGLLARAVFRYADSLSQDDVEEDRDFVWTWAGVRAALRAWLRSVLGRPRFAARFSRRSTPVATPDRALLGPRELYRELLRLGARLGRRRAPSETPREYERALEAVAPLAGAERDLAILTEVYARARYAAEPPVDESVAEARAALERLRRQHDAWTPDSS